MLIRNILKTEQPFVFEAGGILPEINIAYYTSSHQRREGEKVVWICHALTGNADPEDWWAGMVGPGRLIDSDKYFVVCVSMICSPYGECSPASVDPATGRPYMMTFPETTIRDIVNAEIIVRKHLGIESIDLLLGPSIGGFQAMEWSIMEPDVIKKAAYIATTCRITPYLTAYNESQRMALLADPTFMEQKDLHGGAKGLSCARTIALISYRTAEGYNQTQFEKDDDTMFAERASSYQRYQGEKLVKRFDAYSYWYLSRVLDSHNVGRGRGGVNAALAMIKAECAVICINTDCIFTAPDNRKIAAALPNAKYFELTSDFGHDGFLIENDRLVEVIREML